MHVEDDANEVSKEVNVALNATRFKGDSGREVRTAARPGAGFDARSGGPVPRASRPRIPRRLSLTGSVVDAEDVLQTVFLRLSRRGDVNLEPNPGSYLHRAAINAALDLLRQRARTESIPIDDVAAGPGGQS